MLVTLVSKRSGNKVCLNYDPDTYLLSKIELEGDLSSEGIQWLLAQVPPKGAEIEIVRVFAHNFEIVIGASKPPSFDDFWRSYDYKVGRIKAETEWKKLSPADQMKAVSRIKAYKYHAKITGVAHIYPERYLKNKRFTDEYTK